MKSLKALLTVVFSCLFISLFGQEVEMADKFRSDGKIYVVVAIVLVVLAGLVAYLVVIDRKVGRLEKRIGDSSKTK